MVAELITTGTSSIDLAQFRVGRFGAVDPRTDFQRHCAAARSALHELATVSGRHD